MGALIRPTEQGRHQKCQGRNHRLMLPEFLEFRPADPGVARFAQLVKEGNRDRRTARPVSRLARIEIVRLDRDLQWVSCFCIANIYGFPLGLIGFQWDVKM